LGRSVEQVQEERDLVRLCLAGDQTAFATLVGRHQVAVFGTALRLLRDREAAGDVANRALFKAYQALAQFDPDRPLRPWLVQIATNEALNELRGRQREAARTLAGEAAEIAFEQLPGAADPADQALAAVPAEAIRAAVERLPEALRIATVLRYFADLSLAEIGAQTGQTANAVAVTLLRARQRLRRELVREGVNDDVLS
jgi:RNA polymerase sigma-70 factor (ECF subfamily)